MTVETAVVVFAAGIIVVVLLIWYTYRLTKRRLAKIQTDLVSRPINSLTYFSDFLEDCFAGSSPHERGASGVISIDEGLDFGDQVFGADE